MKRSLVVLSLLSLASITYTLNPPASMATPRVNRSSRRQEARSFEQEQREYKIENFIYNQQVQEGRVPAGSPPLAPAPTPAPRTRRIVERETVVPPIPRMRTKKPTMHARAPKKGAIVTDILDVINITDDTLQIFVTDNEGSEKVVDSINGHQLSSIKIPPTARYVYVKGTTFCQPVSLANDLKAVAITGLEEGSYNYAIHAIIPRINNYVFVYNGSGTAQKVFLELDIPSESWFSAVWNSTEKIAIYKEIEPHTAGLIEVPQITTTKSKDKVVKPTKVILSIPTCNNSKDNDINPNLHNTFFITPDNGLLRIS